ncbi:hypothetical protein Q3G72_025331 [Acer saccharum]|nr:hypothetical protein Q3G72_025331 [Acer saccharum]
MDFLSDFSDLTFEFKPPLITILLVTLIALVFEFFWLKFSPLPGKKLPPGSFGFPLLGESAKLETGSCSVVATMVYRSTNLVPSPKYSESTACLRFQGHNTSLLGVPYQIFVEQLRDEEAVAVAVEEESETSTDFGVKSEITRTRMGCAGAR